MQSFFRWPYHHPFRLSLAIIVAAVSTRIFFVDDAYRQDVIAGEAARVAFTLARTGVFGDAYFDGQGPTAHLSPVMPALSAALIRISDALQVPPYPALVTFSLSQVALAYFLAFRLFSRLWSPGVAFGGLSILAIPVFPYYEVVAFRYWDGALSVVLVGAILLIAPNPDGGKRSRAAAVIASGLLGLLMFLNPIAGMATASTLFVCLIARDRTSLGIIAAGSAAVLALFMTGWAIRNDRAVGRAIPLRSNFNLELSLAFYSGALDPPQPYNEWYDHIGRTHPVLSREAAARVAQVGEVAYFDRMGGTTRAWIRENPRSAARLAARHVGQYLLPPGWLYEPFDRHAIRRLASFVVRIVNLLGVTGIAIAIRRRRREGWAAVAFLLPVLAMYSLVQPVPRYTYLIYPFMAFWTAYASAVIGSALLRRPGMSRGPEPQTPISQLPA